MIDFGFDKIALIGAVALIVIGPEKLPRVARTVGTLLGKAQRYVADVKAEVNRSMELDELQEDEDAVRGRGARRRAERRQRGDERQPARASRPTGTQPAGDESSSSAALATTGYDAAAAEYKHPKKNWRLKRGATPQWYKQRHGIRTKALSGAARVARFRPPGAKAAR